MQFARAEEKDGIRMSWNIWPKTKNNAAKLIIPIGCLYSPLRNVTSLAKINSSPVFCKGQNCSGILNAYCQVDMVNKIWVCPFCFTRNHFPISYNAISRDNMPPELVEKYSTIEYCIPSKPFSPVFLFVVDICMSSLELQQVRTSLVHSLLLLPENALVGLITIGKNVSVYELGFQECPKSYDFRGGGDVPVDRKRMAELLGVNAHADGENSVVDRFLVPLADCELAVTAILEELEGDPWIVKPKMRASRCTGKALEYAISLLEISEETKNGRIMLFTGGAASEGPGSVVGLELTEAIRSHRDIFKGEAKYFESASKFYNDLSTRCTASNLIIDIFACSLDQVGLSEMKVLVDKTGGYVILCESFKEEIFKESFKKIFSSSSSEGIAMTFGAELEVNTSREFKIAGAIGPMSAYAKNSKNTSKTFVIGASGTNYWSLGSVTPNTAIAVYFDIANLDSKAIPEGRQAFIQFLTKYKHSVGKTFIRVTTLAIEFADMDQGEGLGAIKEGFDQEAACVLMARWAVFKAENEFASDIFRWLDTTLIKLISQFATFIKNCAETFRLCSEFSFYPQFMFYLRRSPFLSIFNSSPDETAYYRIMLSRENVLNSITMIQPALYSYSLESVMEPALLDIQSCQDDKILLLDSFFNIVVWYGRNITEWNRQRIQDKEEYAYFGDLLRRVDEDADELRKNRMPHSSIIHAEENSSSARHLVAKLNPSVSYNNPDSYGEDRTQPVFTDDVSLNVFMSHLRNVVVGSDK